MCFCPSFSKIFPEGVSLRHVKNVRYRPEFSAEKIRRLHAVHVDVRLTQNLILRVEDLAGTVTALRIDRASGPEIVSPKKKLKADRGQGNDCPAACVRLRALLLLQEADWTRKFSIRP